MKSSPPPDDPQDPALLDLYTGKRSYSYDVYLERWFARYGDTKETDTVAHAGMMVAPWSKSQTLHRLTEKEFLARRVEILILDMTPDWHPDQESMYYHLADMRHDLLMEANDELAQPQPDAKQMAGLTPTPVKFTNDPTPQLMLRIDGCYMAYKEDFEQENLRNWIAYAYNLRALLREIANVPPPVIPF